MRAKTVRALDRVTTGIGVHSPLVVLALSLIRDMAATEFKHFVLLHSLRNWHEVWGSYEYAVLTPCSLVHYFILKMWAADVSETSLHIYKITPIRRSDRNPHSSVFWDRTPLQVGGTRCPHLQPRKRPAELAAPRHANSFFDLFFDLDGPSAILKSCEIL
jgi:hypothetical protein